MVNQLLQLLKSNNFKYINRTFVHNNSKFLQIRRFNKSSTMFKSAVINLQDATKDQVQDFLDSFDTVLTDCDGVLWIDNNAIPGSPEMMNQFRKLGKKIFYVTNNSTKMRSEFAAKATQLGFIASPDEILSTAYLAAHYLKGIGFKKKVYLIGSTGIADELKAVGIRSIGLGPDHVKEDFKNLQPTELDSEVGAVVVGFDEHVSYPKFMKAASYLSNEDCLFVATNTDERFPKQGGSIIVPGTGTLVRAVETCSERKALVLGKPHAYVRKYLESCGLDPSRTLMIGDRIVIFGALAAAAVAVVIREIDRIKAKREEIERRRRIRRIKYLIARVRRYSWPRLPPSPAVNIPQPDADWAAQKVRDMEYLRHKGAWDRGYY